METVDPRELQSLQHYLNEYNQQLEIFTGQLDLMEQGRMEAAAAVESLESLGSAEDGTVLLQVGGGASVRAKVLDPDTVLLNIGAEVVVERPVADAISYLKDRLTEMEASQKKVIETIERIRTQMNEMAKRLEQGYAQMQAAQGAGPVQASSSRPGDEDE
ncbi:MAG: prefoldin subunit alpha [Methanoregulaceae archaeon]